MTILKFYGVYSGRLNKYTVKTGNIARFEVFPHAEKSSSRKIAFDIKVNDSFFRER